MKTPAQHSGGTWGYDGDGFDSVAAEDFDTDGYCVFTKDADGNITDQICELSPVGDDQVEQASAQLIAAAPDLLQACKAMHKGMDYLFALLIEKVPDFYPSKTPVWDAIVQGNEAIEKAKS